MMTIRLMTEQDDVPVSRIVSGCYRFIAEPDGLTTEQLDRMISERCRNWGVFSMWWLIFAEVLIRF